MRTFLKPVDRLGLCFLALLTAILLFFVSAVPAWPRLIAHYLLLAVFIISLAALDQRAGAGKTLSSIRAFAPIMVILMIFNSLGDLIPWIWPAYLDDIFIKIDHALFGVHPTVWLERFVHPLLTDLFQIAYITYYPMAITLGVVLYAKNRRKEFDEAIFGVILCFYLSYLGYILFPAIGPRFTLIHLQTMDLKASQFTIAVQETLNALEHNKTDAFPSGHTAVALMTLFYAWKYREKILFRILAPTVSALIVSTVYLRYHYVIDVIAGVLLAALTLLIAPRAYRILSGSSNQPQG